MADLKLSRAVPVALLMAAGCASTSIAAPVHAAPRLSSSVTAGQVRLSWTPVRGARSYQVSRKVLAGFKARESVTGTSWVDAHPPRLSLVYRVRARLVKGFGPAVEVTVDLVPKASFTAAPTPPVEDVPIAAESAVEPLASTPTPPTATAPQPPVVTTPDPPVVTTPDPEPAPDPTPDPIPDPVPDPVPDPTPDPTTAGTVFVDDFNGPAGSLPDQAKWTDYGKGCGAYAGWGAIRCGADETLDGQGHLILPATSSWGSALQTRGKFGFVYGTASAWIKMPAQAGYWPGFWMLNGSQTGSEALTGETDITEVYSQWPGSNATAHVWNGGDHLWDRAYLTARSTDLTSGFHKYTAKLEPGRMTFYLDDAQVGVVDKSSGSPWAWGPDVMRPNFLIFDMAVRGGGQTAPSTSGQMVVDRVEVLAP